MPQTALITADELARMRDGDEFELVRGKLVRVIPPNAPHGRIAVEIGARLLAFVKARGLGTVLGETGYVVERGPDTVRGPDVSFVRVRHADLPDTGFIGRAPTLAVEIVSPRNTKRQLLGKAAEYIAAGAELVWIVDSRKQTALAITPTGSTEIARDGVLDGGGTLPGFSLSLAELFA